MGFENGPEGGSETNVERQVELLRGSTTSRDVVLSDLQRQIDNGELTFEEATDIATQVGAF